MDGPEWFQFPSVSSTVPSLVTIRSGGTPSAPCRTLLLSALQGAVQPTLRTTAVELVS
jgi:hypothetical protein